MIPNLTLIIIAAVAVIALVVALVVIPARLVRGLNPPDDDEIHWT